MFYDIFCALCQKKGVSVTKATIEIGLSRTIGTKWKNTGATPNGETLNKIANYFGVSINTLLGNETEQKEEPILTPKDERDISRRLEETLAQLEDSQDGLMFDGEPLDDITRELLLTSLKNSMEIGKKIAKKKYTPKKYQK